MEVMVWISGASSDNRPESTAEDSLSNGACYHDDILVVVLQPEVIIIRRESFQGHTRGLCLGCLSKAQAMAPFVSQCYPRSRHGIPNQQACLVQSQSGARLACNFMPVYLPNGAL